MDVKVGVKVDNISYKPNVLVHLFFQVQKVGKKRSGIIIVDRLVDVGIKVLDKVLKISIQKVYFNVEAVIDGYGVDISVKVVENHIDHHLIVTLYDFKMNEVEVKNLYFVVDQICEKNTVVFSYVRIHEVVLFVIGADFQKIFLDILKQGFELGIIDYF